MPNKTKLKNAAIAAQSAALPNIPKALRDYSTRARRRMSGLESRAANLAPTARTSARNSSGHWIVKVRSSAISLKRVQGRDAVRYGLHRQEQAESRQSNFQTAVIQII
jgi:hypothetical protein